MSDVGHLSAIVAWSAFALAFLFGAVAQKVDFCVMGSISDIVNIGDWRRMRMWVLAIAVAILSANALQAAGLVDLGKSIYLNPRVPWLSHLVGGALFGFGMTLASGCGSKTLLRAGAGNLKSLVVLVFLGISAYMTLKGAFAVWRVYGLDPIRFDAGGTQAIPDLLVRRLSLGPSMRFAACVAVAAALLAFVFASREFRETRRMIIGGIFIGGVIAAGWYVTGHIGYLAEDPDTLQEAFVGTNSARPESFSFVAPVAYSLGLLLLWTDKSEIVTFGVAAVAGMLLGSTAMALATRTFRWESFASREDLVNHMMGGLLMGFGGITALGCTIGQGLTGISTLAIGSILSVAAIIAGCVSCLKYQEWRWAGRA